MRRDVKRNCILIFLYMHDISCLSFLTFKRNNEMYAGVFRLLPICTKFYSSGKYLNLNSDICVYSDFRNTPTHFISESPALLLYSKRNIIYEIYNIYAVIFKKVEFREACCTLHKTSKDKEN